MQALTGIAPDCCPEGSFPLMCDILAMPQPHIVINGGDAILVLPISDLRRLASGQVSLSEFNEPDLLGKILAIALLEKL